LSSQYFPYDSFYRVFILRFIPPIMYRENIRCAAKPVIGQVEGRGGFQRFTYIQSITHSIRSMRPFRRVGFRQNT
jgi:hypothetical protein